MNVKISYSTGDDDIKCVKIDDNSIATTYIEGQSNGECEVSSFPSLVGTLPVTSSSIDINKSTQASNEGTTKGGTTVEEKGSEYSLPKIDPGILLVVLGIDILLAITGFLGHRMDVREGKGASKYEQTKLVS